MIAMIPQKRYREKTTRDRLIVMDGVLGLADESKKFASFLTVACKLPPDRVYKIS